MILRSISIILVPVTRIYQSINTNYRYCYSSNLITDLRNDAWEAFVRTAVDRQCDHDSAMNDAGSTLATGISFVFVIAI